MASHSVQENHSKAEQPEVIMLSPVPEVQRTIQSAKPKEAVILTIASSE